MEPTERDKYYRENKKSEDDIDLGMIIYKIGVAIRGFFRLLGNGIKILFDWFIYSLLFIRRNFVWLLIGTSLGLAFGIYQNITVGSKYSSALTVRTNFGSARALYSAIDYLNALIGSGNKSEISALFNISDAEASSLLGFSVEPVDDELVIAKMYETSFLEYEKNDFNRTDTFWSKTITYKEFKNLVTKFDYPLHTITSVSTNQKIFGKLQGGIIKLLSENEVLKGNKSIARQTFAEEESLLRNSLSSLDTLQKAYNQMIQQKGTTGGSGTMVNLFDKEATVNAPELDVYDKVLLLKNQLKMVRAKSAESRDIIQVYSSFNSVANKQGFLRQSIVKQSITGLLLTLALLIILNLNRYLKALEIKRKATVKVE